MTTRPGPRPTAAAHRSSRRARARAVGARAVGALASALVATGLVAGGALPASAHDRLVSSDPASGAVLGAVPEEAVLTFSAEVQELGTVVELQDASGERAGEGATSVEGRGVVLPVPVDLGNGEYVLVYRVTSSDGHPISGEVPFTLDLATAPSPSTTSGSDPGAGVAPSSSASTAPSPSADAGATPSATGGALTDDAEPAASSQDTGLPLAPVVVVLVVLALGAAAAVVLTRGRRAARTR